MSIIEKGYAADGFYWVRYDCGIALFYASKEQYEAEVEAIHKYQDSAEYKERKRRLLFGDQDPTNPPPQ